MNVTMFVLYTILLIMLYYNIRAKSKKVAILNIVLILIVLIITWIYNGTFILKCINNYQFKAEKIKNYEELNLGFSIIPYNLFLMMLFVSSLMLEIINGIINVIKQNKDKNQTLKRIMFIILVYGMQSIFMEIMKAMIRSNVPDTYTEEMIANEVKQAQFLIHLGIFTNILASNLFILMNFKNRKENVSDVKGENS